MDNSKRKNLQILLERQEDELKLYKTKLRDLVIAHKGLLKEKEALEVSLNALRLSEQKKVENDSKQSNNSEETPSTSTSLPNETHSNPTNSEMEELQKKVTTLANSLIAINEEKTRIEERLKADNREIRTSKEILSSKCQEQERKLSMLSKELEDMHSQIVNERRDREIERNDLTVRLKDSQSLLNSERELKKQLQNKLGELLRNQNGLTDVVISSERTVNSLQDELDSSKEKLKSYERKLQESFDKINNLQDEMKNLAMEHQSEILKEKERARGVEEQSRMLSAVHEERVANLETKLAQLSEIVGSNDRLRQRDKSEIQKLKGRIALLDSNGFSPAESIALVGETPSSNEDETDRLLSKLSDIKSQLMAATEKSGKNIDFLGLFADNNQLDIHESCADEYNKLRKEFELFKSDSRLRGTGSQEFSKEKITLQNQVKSLQERLKVTTEHNREMEKEYKLQLEQLKKAMKNEKARFKETLAASEADYRGRLCLLEQQLQKQRERSLVLLEEKEQEIHSLQSTFQMFLPGYRRGSESLNESHETETETKVPVLSPMSDGPHMLHYANELARRDVEIANLRKNKHKVEIALRELQKAAVSDTEKHRDERQALREEIARLNRCQTREGANLEYLKNVVLSFLTSSDPSSKRHMCNAIAAVLKFSEEELEKVTQHSRNSWWNRSNFM